MVSGHRVSALADLGNIVRLKTPISIALIINLLVTTLIAVIAGLAAYNAVDIAVERSIKEEVSRDLAVMLQRAPERGIIPDIAVLTNNIDARLFEKEFEKSDSVYLLANSSGEKIIGNAVQMPDIPTNSWVELDGSAIGVGAGPLLLHRVSIEPDFAFLTGRRLTARDSLNRWFVPVMIGTVIVLGMSSSLLLGFINHRFRRRIRHINSIFGRVERGDLSARVLSTSRAAFADDLSQLSSNVDKALAEVERLLRGLESYSQVAAHELNHSISNLRNRIADTGHADIAAEADRLIQLVTHILELAKIEATPGFAMKPLALESVVQSVVKLFSEAFEERSIVLRTDISCAPANVLGSRPLIESALVNLVSNALKHAPTGSSVSIILKQDSDRIVMSVRDQGGGVDSTKLDVLAALGRKQDSGGNGFGLRHVEAVAIRHGAKLSLENAGPGLLITLRFRAMRPD